jgi:hypothetical protein
VSTAALGAGADDISTIRGGLQQPSFDAEELGVDHTDRFEILDQPDLRGKQRLPMERCGGGDQQVSIGEDYAGLVDLRPCPQLGSMVPARPASRVEAENLAAVEELQQRYLPAPTLASKGAL